MDHEFQNEVNRTRHLLKMKKLKRCIKDKDYFELIMKKLEQSKHLRRRR